MSTTRIIFKPLGSQESYCDTLEEIEGINAQESDIKKYSNDDIKSIINNAYDEGYSKAKQEVDREKLHYKEVLAHAINNITNKIEEIKPIISDVNIRSSKELLNFSFVLVKKILGEYFDKNYQNILKLKIENCLKLVVREPILRILINPEIEDFIRNEVANIKRNSSFLGEIIIISEPNLHKLSCVVEWEDGFAKVDYQDLFNQIEKLISENV